MSRERIEKVFSGIGYCMDDQFQDWLISVGLMKIADSDIDSLKFKHSLRSESGPRLDVLEVLGHHMRRIVPTSDFAQQLYQKDDVYSRKKANNRLLGIKNDLVDGNVLYHATEIGWGLGVTDFVPSPRDVVLMHYFKENEGLWIPTYKISYNTGMSEDAISCRIGLWRDRVDYSQAFSVRSERSSGKGYLFEEIISGRMEAA